MSRVSPGKSNAESVLLTDGDARATLATTRSLGNAGYAVHVASTNGRSLAGASRWCRGDHAVGDPETASVEWAKRIESLAAELSACVLPITEVAIGSLFNAASETRLDIVAPTSTDYAAAIDKFGLVERALRIGIDVPVSTLVEEFGALDKLPAPHRFPVVAKPRRSRLFFQNRWISPPVQVLRNEADLRQAIRSWLPEHGDTLLQEFVPGRGEGLFAFCSAGQIQARFAHRRLREKPPLGGVSVLRESVEIAPDIARAGELLLADLGFGGLAMVEFRRAPTGRLVLMEINPRPWGSLQLAIDAGVDFPTLMVNSCRGVSPNTPSHPSINGVRTRWLLGDFDHWLACVRSRTLRRELDTSIARVSLEFLRSFFDGCLLEVMKWNDPRPFRRELTQWFAALFHPPHG